MDCRKAERSITQFVHDDMDKKDMEEFICHIYECESCKEELSIQYLITEGMSRLEEGKTFSLQDELDLKLEQAWRRAVFYKWLKRILYTLETVALIAAIVMAVIVILR